MVWPLVAASIGSAVIGGAMSSRAQSKANSQNMAWNYDQAKNQYQWRVADMKKAGLHPTLAAGTSPSSGGIASRPETGLGDAVSRAGSNALQAMYQQKQMDMLDAQIKNQELLNKQLETEIAGQNTLKAPVQTDVTTPLSIPEMIDPAAARQTVPGAEQDKTRYQFITPKGQKIPVSKGTAQFLTQLKDIYHIDEFVDWIGGYYALKDWNTARLKKAYQEMLTARKNKYRKQDPYEKLRYEEWRKTPSDIPDW